MKRAILIGIDRPGERIRKDDVAMVKKVLLSRCSLAEADIIELGDKKHKEDVAAVFETLKQKSKQEDALLIYVGGDSTSRSLVLDYLNDSDGRAEASPRRPKSCRSTISTRWLRRSRAPSG